MCRAKGLFGGVLVADLPIEADVPRCFVVQLGRAFLRRVRDGDDDAKSFVIDADGFGGVLRGLAGLGDHHRDTIADEPHPVLGERRIGRLLDRSPVGREAARQAADAVGLEVTPGQDRDDAFARLCRRDVDAPDPRMGVRAADEMRIGLSGPVDVIGEIPPALQEPDVFRAADRRADTRFRHLLNLPSLARPLGWP